ncbi:MAG: hypothetical protein ACOCRX_05685 [Candidatus Woesearchaeota archaeon]
MGLIQIVEKESIRPVTKAGEYDINKIDKPMIYSPKLEQYVPLDAGKPKGEIQKYNVGMGPGSWY